MNIKSEQVSNTIQAIFEEIQVCFVHFISTSLISIFHFIFHFHFKFALFYFSDNRQSSTHFGFDLNVVELCTAASTISSKDCTPRKLKKTERDEPQFEMRNEK